MTDLQELPGIGSGLAAELRACGIRDAEALRSIGPPEAARRLAELGMREAAPTQQVLAAALGAARGGALTLRPEPVLGIDSVVFTVGDLDAALDHYVTSLGLTVSQRSTDPPTALLRLGDGTAGLLLREDPAVSGRALPDSPAADTTAADTTAADNPAAGAAPGAAPRVRLIVGNTTAAAESLRSAGVAIGVEPDGRPGARSGTTVEVTDRWGNVVELVVELRS